MSLTKLRSAVRKAGLSVTTAAGGLVFAEEAYALCVAGCRDQCKSGCQTPCITCTSGTAACSGGVKEINIEVGIGL